MRPTLNDRFYDQNYLDKMSRAMLSSELDTSLPLTREALGCGQYQTETYEEYTPEQKVHIQGNCINKNHVIHAGVIAER